MSITSNLRRIARIVGLIHKPAFLGSRLTQAVKCAMYTGNTGDACVVPDSPLFMDPSHRVAIITGGTSGIGFSVAFELLQEGAAHVVLTGCSKEDPNDAVRLLNAKFGAGKAAYFCADVTTMCDLDNTFKFAVAKYNRVDIMFNNAGIWSDRDWEQSVDTNIMGTIRGCFMALRYMSQDMCGHGGIIVNCASTLGIDSLPSCPVYTTTQHAIVGLTKSLGHPFHCNRRMVRVVALCPGVTLTDMAYDAPNRQLTGFMGVATKQWMETQACQEVYSVARAFVYVVRHGYSGGLYTIEGSNLSYVTPPEIREVCGFQCEFPKSRRCRWF